MMVRYNQNKEIIKGEHKMNKVLQVVNQKGIPFNVRFVEKGQ